MDDLPILTSPAVSTHLFIISGLVFAIVIVGGLTRLTESGLSITEWNLVTGTLPPLTQEAWQSEYDKYMVTPEGTLMNKDMSVNEFKRIYGWEWGHRFLGRIIGLAFLAPIPYFLIKRKASKKTAAILFGIATLIGGQGALGWYMVKSGITTEAIQARDGVPRVSQYRLAAHLGMAFLVYALSLRHALAIRRDWGLARLGKDLSGLPGRAQESVRLLNTRQAKRLRYMTNILTGLVFFTAISGESPARLAGSQLSSVCRRFCGWSRCRTAIQHVPIHGGDASSPDLRAVLAQVLSLARSIRSLHPQLAREPVHGANGPPHTRCIDVQRDSRPLPVRSSASDGSAGPRAEPEVDQGDDGHGSVASHTRYQHPRVPCAD